MRRGEVCSDCLLSCCLALTALMVFLRSAYSGGYPEALSACTDPQAGRCAIENELGICHGPSAMYVSEAVLLRTLCKGSLQYRKAVKKLAVIDNERSVIDDERKAKTVNTITVGDAQETALAKGLTCSLQCMSWPVDWRLCTCILLTVNHQTCLLDCCSRPPAARSSNRSWHCRKPAAFGKGR